MQYRNEHEQYEAEAYEMGVSAAKAAATWCVDGNTKNEAIPAVVKMFDDGDPAVDDYLPAPGLSGEWADDPTPQSLARDIMGSDYRADDPMVDALADAYERGVSETFLGACEAEFREGGGVMTHIHRIEDPRDGELIDIAVFCSDGCHRDWCQLHGAEYGGWDGCHDTEHNDWCATCGVVLPGVDACEHQANNVAVRRFLGEGEMCECGNWIQFPLDRLTQA